MVQLSRRKSRRFAYMRVVKVVTFGFLVSFLFSSKWYGGETQPRGETHAFSEEAGVSVIRCFDTARHLYAVRSVYQRSGGYEILAEIPRHVVQVRRGCSLRESTQDRWAFEQSTSFTHKHVIVFCEDDWSGSTPFIGSHCNPDKLISNAVDIRYVPQEASSGVVACLAPLFAHPAKNLWEHWLDHALVHYDHIFAYVVGNIDEHVKAVLYSMQDFVTVINWPMVLATGDLEHLVSEGLELKTETLGVGRQELPYYGQYLALLDCQRRAIRQNFSWFQPTEMDLFVDTTPVAGVSSMRNFLRRFAQERAYDEIHLQLTDRLVKLQTSAGPLSWDIITQNVRHNSKYVAHVTTPCEACVHFLCCDHKLEPKRQGTAKSNMNMVHMRIAT